MKKNVNQNGIALVSSLLLIAIISILSATLMQMSYLAYSRKLTEKKDTETFYTAEAAIDSVKAYVQNVAAAQIVNATADKKDFTKAVYSSLLGISTSGLADNASLMKADDTTGKIQALEDRLRNKIIYKTDSATGALVPKTDEPYYKSAYNNEHTVISDGISSVNGGEFSIQGIRIKDDTVVIEGVYLKYVNNEGYVAEITTDIVVKAPVYAQDIVVPAGSYSMFAGNGATVDPDSSTGYKDTAMNNMLYYHQEGNVYVGTKNQTAAKELLRPQVALEIGSHSSSAKGNAYISIGGTNAVFNGNVYIDDGCTMIFTGGDGKENANVQVNGYIYMADGATLLLAPNINLVCKGIKVKENGSTSYTDYTGASVVEDDLSQFFPTVETAVSSLSVYTDKFLTNKADVAECLLKVVDNSPTPDTRATNVYNGTAKCGVYILNATSSETAGWYDRTNNTYSKVTCTDGVWNCSADGLYQGQIVANPLDPKLSVVPKVAYMGKGYDPVFASIVNIPYLKLWETFSNSALLADNGVNNHYTGYDPTDSNTYSTVKFKEINTKFSLYGTSFLNKFNFAHMNVMGSPTFGSRDLRIPSNLTSDKFVSGSTDEKGKSYTDIDTKSRGTISAYASEIGVGVKGGDGVLSASNNGYSIYVSSSNIKIHAVKGAFVGIYMTADGVTIGQSTGVSRGMSLLEMAKDDASGVEFGEVVRDETGKIVAENAVSKMLKRLAGNYICKSYNEDWLNNFSGITANSQGAAFNIFDNVFNGGVETFWSTANRVSSSGSGTANNSGLDFVTTDNWDKD